MKIIEWNINQRAKHLDSKIIPTFISSAILEEDPDFFVLTEFYQVEELERFKKSLSEYQIFTTENSQHHQNDVCIGVKNTYTDVQIASLMESRRENPFPNFLHLLVELDNMTLSLMGVRIRIPAHQDIAVSTEESQRYRLDQFCHLESYIAYIQEPAILVGDFNNYRRGHSPATMAMLKGETPEQCDIFNMHILSERANALGYEMCTPEGFSWGKDNENVKYQFAQDHAFIKGVTITHQSYEDEFMKYAPEIYEEQGIRGVATPYPDHKMLVTEFEINS
ncbi:MAG: hypothetical protein R3Y63_13070 [Eubacteriales bacterium]